MSRHPTSSWPPVEPAKFIRSERFGRDLLAQCERLRRTNPDLDLTDAVAHVFEWLDRKLERDPSFLNETKFPTSRAFWAYIRTALRRAALLVKRKLRRRPTQVLPQDSPVFDLSPSPDAMAQRDEIIDRLGYPCAEIVRRILESDRDLDVFAASLDMTRDELEAAFEGCLDRMRKDPEVSRFVRVRGHRRS